MQPNVTTKVDPVHVRPCRFKNIRHRVAYNTGIQMACMQHFKRVWIGVFGNNYLALPGLRNRVGSLHKLGKFVIAEPNVDKTWAGNSGLIAVAGQGGRKCFGDVARTLAELFSQLHGNVCGEIAELRIGPRHNWVNFGIPRRTYSSCNCLSYIFHWLYCTLSDAR